MKNNIPMMRIEILVSRLLKDSVGMAAKALLIDNLVRYMILDGPVLICAHSLHTPANQFMGTNFKQTGLPTEIFFPVAVSNPLFLSRLKKIISSLF